MKDFSKYTRRDIVAAANLSRKNVVACVKNRMHDKTNWMREELQLRNETIALRQLLLKLEAQERDELAVELQKAELEMRVAAIDAENKRAE